MRKSEKVFSILNPDHIACSEQMTRIYGISFPKKKMLDERAAHPAGLCKAGRWSASGRKRHLHSGSAGGGACTDQGAPEACALPHSHDSSVRRTGHLLLRFFWLKPGQNRAKNVRWSPCYFHKNVVYYFGICQQESEWRHLIETA